jgi:hypothetical protein
MSFSPKQENDLTQTTTKVAQPTTKKPKEIREPTNKSDFFKKSLTEPYLPIHFTPKGKLTINH